MNLVASSKLITFEGGEGAGKSTLIQKVADWLVQSGNDVVVTFEPGATHFGEKIRSLLLHKSGSEPIAPTAELLLFLADRMQHIKEVINPALSSGKIVLCDRFHDSTIAYQGGGRELGVEQVEKMCYAICGSLTPHLTLYLDVDPKIGIERARHSDLSPEIGKELDRIESQEMLFHDRVRDVFFQLLKNHPRRMCLVDASQTVDLVFAEIREILSSRLC